MGTSSSYNGPVGRNPLLPPWAVDIPDSDNENHDTSPTDNEDNEGQVLDGQPQSAPIQNPSVIATPNVSWRGAKGVISKMANGRRGSWNSALRSYVRARGGSRTAAISSPSGRAVTGRLGGFLTDVVSSGVTRAVRNLGLGDYVGRDAQSFLAALVDVLAPAGALLEEAIARKALIETVTELFERFDVTTDGIPALEQIDAESMEEILILSITNYINERFEQELVNCIERGTISEDGANQLAEEAKGFIAGIVALDIEDVDVTTFDWTGTEGKLFINDLYQMAYSLLGDTK